MKFLHLADLHIGKKIKEYPLFEDQRFALNQAMELAKSEDVDAIVVAGDVYDSSAPSAESMEFYDWFLTSFHALGKPMLIIAGNHDSAERLSVASEILKSANIHIVSSVKQAMQPVVIQGVSFYLLPYFRPSEVNHAFGCECKSYESAMKEVLARMAIDTSKPNVLVTHQAILPVGGKLVSSGSETSVDIDSYGDVGGSETINVCLFDDFDYLALGHIHKAQNISPKARYAGALLKYHVKEATAQRGFTIVDVQGKKATVAIRPIRLLRDLAVLQGTLEEILATPGHQGDYVFARLMDEQFVDSPFDKLKAKFPYCLGLDYPRLNGLVREEEEAIDVEEVDKTTLFSTFFEEYGDRPLDEKEKAFVKSLFDAQEENA